MKTSNKNASQAILTRELFKANNLFSESVGSLYIVYSYGYHYPMYVFNDIDNIAYENKDKYSVSTSKHKTQARLLNVEYKPLNTQELKELINKARYNQ